MHAISTSQWVIVFAQGPLPNGRIGSHWRLIAAFLGEFPETASGGLTACCCVVESTWPMLNDRICRSVDQSAIFAPSQSSVASAACEGKS